MKKIINGKKYDTDTAKEIGSYTYGYPSDFDYEAETLYQKRNGELFLFCTGGPKSAYSKCVGKNEWSGSSLIDPICESEAKEWAEKHLNGDEYEELFGEVEE